MVAVLSTSHSNVCFFQCLCATKNNVAVKLNDCCMFAGDLHLCLCFVKMLRCFYMCDLFQLWCYFCTLFFYSALLFYGYYNLLLLCELYFVDIILKFVTCIN